MFIQFVAPLFLVFFWFLILAVFGKLFTRQITNVVSEQLFYGFGVGYVIWALLLYVSPNPFLNNVINLGIFSTSLASLRCLNKTSVRKYLEVVTIKRAFICIVLAIVWIMPVFNSGWIADGAMVFHGVNAHDGVWHMALMETLASYSSRVMPAFSQHNLEGYHYLVDLTGSEFVRLFTINSQDLVFRVYPFLFGLLALYGINKLSFALLPSTIKLNQKRKFLLEIFSGMLLVGGSSLAYILPIIGLQYTVNESAFWMHQNISTWVNLPLGVSFSLFALTLNFSILVYRKPNVLSVCLLGLLIGSHLGFKAYGGILLLISAVYFGLWLLNKRLIVLGFAFLVACAVSFLLIGRSALGSPQSAGLEWNPGWFVKTMFEAPDRMNLPRWELRRLSYSAKSNYFGLIGLWTAGTIIFILGNMGSRLFGLYGLRKVNNFEKGQFVVLIATALLFPLLFTQSGVSWNTIQFGYYAYVLLTPLVIVALAGVERRATLLALIVGFVAFPASIFTITNQISLGTSSAYVVSNSNLIVLQQLKQLDPGSVLAPYEDKAIVPALSGKPCFYCNQKQTDLLQIYSPEAKNVVEKSFDITTTAQGLASLMKRHNITYLYFPEQVVQGDNKNAYTGYFEIVASSGDAAIYRRK